MCENVISVFLSAVKLLIKLHQLLISNINVSYRKNVTDVGISALGEGCPLLSSIDLSGCGKVTDIGISAICWGCPLFCNIRISSNF